MIDNGVSFNRPSVSWLMAYSERFIQLIELLPYDDIRRGGGKSKRPKALFWHSARGSRQTGDCRAYPPEMMHGDSR